MILRPIHRCIFACARTFLKNLSTMLGQTSGVISPHQGKKICPEMVFFFLFNWKITSNNKYLNYATPNLKWHNTFIIKVTNLIILDFWFFIRSKFTKNVQNILHLNQCTHNHVRWATIVPFQSSRGGCESSDSPQQCFGEVCLYIQFELNRPTIGILRFTTDKNLRDWDQHVVGLYLKN